MGKKIKIALLGANRIGKIHYQTLSKLNNVELIYICDIMADDTWKEKYPFARKIVTDYHEALEDREVEAVLICLPTNLHPKVIKEAAEAGKNIFCEKPLGFDDKEIEIAYGAVKKANIKFQLGFNRRFDNNFSQIEQQRRSGIVGETEILKITSRDPMPPSKEYVKVSGGLFMDMMIHDFDLARFIMGKDVASVHTFASPFIDPSLQELDDVDTAIVSLQFEDGSVGVIDNSRRAVYGYDQRVELFGSNAMVKAENVAQNTVVTATTQASTIANPVKSLSRYKQAYFSELADFIDSVINETETKCTFEDGIKASQLAKAARKSFETGKTINLNN